MPAHIDAMKSERKKLGLWMATSLVTGNMIGSGIFLLPASLAVFGGISIFGWLCSAIGSILLASVFAGLARQIRGSGGPYLYTRAGFGDVAGFLVAWGYWIALVATNAAIAIALVSYLSVVCPPLKDHGWLGTSVTLALVWLLVAVNIRGIKQAGEVQLVSTVLKILPLLAVGAIGLFHLEPVHFQPWNLGGGSTFSAVTATAALTLWAFLGMESANIPAAEVHDPDRNVPRAAVAGTLIAAVVYIPGTIAVMGLIAPDQLAGSNAPFADAAALLWGQWGYYLIGLGAIVSCFGALNGWTLCLGQVPMAAANDNLFPKFFAEESKFGTPAKGIIVSSVLVSLLVLMNASESLVDQFTHVILLATLATLLPYLLCALARLTIAIKTGSALSPLDVLVSLLAAAFSIWAIMGTGMDTVYWGGFLLMLGLPVHVWVQWRNRRNP
jgi:APA family basic amino acid/polyamine antiporter